MEIDLKIFTFNVKCIVFSLVIMAIFMYDPSWLYKNKMLMYLVLWIIFVISYVAMAWYDYFFDCSTLPLEKGKYGITGLFKPEAHEPEKQYRGKKNEIDTEKHHTIIYLAHVLFFAPLIAYIAYYGKKTTDWVFQLLGVLAVYTLFYHSSQLIELSH